MMKKKGTALILVLLLSTVVFGQKYACVNTDYVMKNIPEYSSAQKRIDKYVQDWQKEIEEKEDELEAMRAEFEQESYLLPENLKKRRKEEIDQKMAEIREARQEYFGAGGSLDKRREELLKPIQDRVYSAIERIAQEKNYAFVFDKAGSATLLFVNKKYDISDEVLEKMGVKPGSVQTEQAPTNRQGRDNKKNLSSESRSTEGGKASKNGMTPLGATKK